MLQAGDLAPHFSLPDADMEKVTLQTYRGKKKLVVYFYPKDDTPGCTLEALEFTDLHSEFEGLGAEILGISRDNCTSHGAFRDKHGLNVRLLADTDGEVCHAFGVWQQREINSQIREGVVRSTFVIDALGVVRHALYDVKPKGHASQVLELVRAL
jgi:peroxiredoxin Q/BCP/two-component system osmolarity sensor histidine kinase EnvZ